MDCNGLLGKKKGSQGGVRERKCGPKLRGGTLETRRGGSRQKHIIEGRRSVNEGSMHCGPQLLTPPSSPQNPPTPPTPSDADTRSPLVPVGFISSASPSCRLEPRGRRQTAARFARDLRDKCVWRRASSAPPAPHPVPSTPSQERDVSGSPRTLLLLFKIF